MEKPKFSIDGNKLLIEDKKISIIFLDDVILVDADGNYCDIYTKTKTFKSIRGQIGQMETMLSNTKYPHTLARVHKSYIVNIDLLKEVDPKQGTITFLIDRKLDPVKIGGNIARELLKHLKKEKRIEVLSAFARKQMLNVPIKELNDTHEFEMGVEYVDLGLTSGTLWATKNLSAPQDDMTEYYGWGQLYLNDSYDKDGYRQTPSELQKVDILPLEYDVARQDWGGGWRMPTQEDFEELSNECILIWCVAGNERRHGILVTGPNGNCIFLPSGGKKDGVNIVSEREAAYWTATNNPKCPCKAEAAVFMDFDDDNNKALLMTHAEDWCSGLSIRPVLKEPTNADVPKIKTELIFHDFNLVIDDNHFHRSPILHAWKFADLDIPIEPKEALAKMKRLCDKYSPDIIVGIGTGAFLVHQLKGYKRICVNPDLHPSKSFPVGSYTYIDYNRNDLGKNYDGDEVTFEITNKIQQQFIDVEKHQFDDIDDNNCWGLFSDIEEEYAEEFGIHYSNVIEIPELKNDDSWQDVILVPLIKEITK